VGADRAIVTAIPGTTRDLLRETIDFEGVRLGVVDTAGIRQTEDEVEREGVARARGAGGVADVVLLVLDRSRALADEDRALLRETAGAPRIAIVNKSDLAPAWEVRDLPGGPAAVLVSLKTGAGMDGLRLALREALGMQAGIERDAPIVSNLRHAALLAEARASIDRAIANLRAAGEQASEELVIADIAGARRAFESVTGRRTSDDVLRHIFANFCVGK
jgi:tRNA modification GTPase